MHDILKNVRFSIKPTKLNGENKVELARTLPIHPLTYQELPYDPEYSHYAGRLTTEKLSNATPDEMYWKTRQEIILIHTGEYPYQISGVDSFKLLQKMENLSVIGPIMIGGNNPFQIVQMGASVSDIVNSACISTYNSL